MSEAETGRSDQGSDRASDGSNGSDGSEPGREARLAARLAADVAGLAVADDEAGLTRLAVDQVSALVPGADLCGITQRGRRGRLDSLAVTDELAARSDELQYELDEGPCVAAATDDAPAFLVDDTARDARWPRWGPRVAELGVRSVLSVRLPATGMHDRHAPLGAINLYARAPGALGSADAALVGLYARHLAVVWASLRRARTLADAAESRHVIGLAQGLLMAQLGLTQDSSFELLQRLSSTSNTKVRDLAAAVVAAGRLPDLGTGDLGGLTRSAPR